LAADATRLYDAVHEAAVSVLAARGIDARLRDDRRSDIGNLANAAAPPFLCFLRTTPGDVLVGNIKVCGSAQRRRQGAILQHGSLILARSGYAPEVVGVAEASDKSLDAADLTVAWAAEIGRQLTLALTAGELAPEEAAAARRRKAEKYTQPLWNGRR
jgi:lipoate-protein ligase A